MRARLSTFGRWLKKNVLFIVVFISVFIAVVSLPTIVYQQYEGNRSQNTHHAQTAKKDKEIVSLLQAVRTAQQQGHQSLSEIKALQKEVATVIAGLPAADAALGHFAIWIEGCLSTGNCSNPPAMQ